MKFFDVLSLKKVNICPPLLFVYSLNYKPVGFTDCFRGKRPNSVLNYEQVSNKKISVPPRKTMRMARAFQDQAYYRARREISHAEIVNFEYIGHDQTNLCNHFDYMLGEAINGTKFR